MQNKVSEFNKNRKVHLEPMPVYARILDIQSEMGELAKEYLKHSSYGTKDFNLKEDFIMEFGDVLYSLLSLAEELEIDAEMCLKLALNKYQERIEKNNSMGSKKEQ